MAEIKVATKEQWERTVWYALEETARKAQLAQKEGNK